MRLLDGAPSPIEVDSAAALHHDPERAGGGGPRRPGLWRRYASDRMAVAACVFLLLVVIVGVFAPWVAPHDPNQQSLINAYKGPGSGHWLGTDELGRDELSRMIAATRTSLLAILEAMGIAVVIGVPVGLAAGFVQGWADRVIMRVTDMLFAIPALVLVMIVIAALGTGLGPSMAALGFVFSTGFVRVTRNAVVAIREESYIAASTVVGLPRRAIIARHVLPNALGPIVVQTILQAGVVLTVEASLSFIGLGVQPPEASWGTLLATAASSIQGADSLLILWPGIAITATVLAMNLVGDGLLAAIAPRRAARARLSLAALRRLARRGGSRPPAPTTPTTVVIAEPDADADRAPLLSVNGLTITAGEGEEAVEIVTDVSIDLHAGEVVGLVGESGCGKSTISLAMIGLLDDQRRVTAGSVRLAGRELVGLSESQWQQVRGREIAMIFQNPVASLNPSLTVGAQVAESFRLSGQGKREAHREALALLGRVGLPDPQRVARQYPHEFSGGMAQRVMIAMAVASRPKVLIADEPVTALDVHVREQMIDLILDLREEYGMAVLLVTHDLGVVADACDRTVVAYAGNVVEQAASATLFADPRHPYTEGLLRARPAALSAERLPTIPGAVPVPGDWPPGCRFEPRCPHALPECSKQPVPVSLVAPEHESRCLRSEDGPWL